MYEIFEELCRKRGVTAYRVCRELGLGTSVTSNWKAGRYRPKADKLQRIADYFGVSIEYLLTGHDTGTTSDLCMGSDTLPTLTETELDLIRMFRMTDDRGRATITTLLSFECSRYSSDNPGQAANA